MEQTELNRVIAAGMNSTVVPRWSRLEELGAIEVCCPCDDIG